MARARMVAAGALTLALSGTAIGMASVAAGSAAPRAATTESGELTPVEEARLNAGRQLARPGTGATGANPVISYLPDLHGVDMMSWQRVLTERSQGRAAPSAAVQAAASPGGRLSPVLTYREKEPAGVGGRNDTTWTGERVTPFGTAAGARNRMVVTGALADLSPTARQLTPSAEDDGAIPLARQTGIAGNGRITVTGTIGDGPHGTRGDKSGDFDWYAVTAKPGETIRAELSGADEYATTMIADATGTLLALGWQVPGGGDAQAATYYTTTGGTFYVQVTLGSMWQKDSFDSGSGTGQGPTTRYSLNLGSWRSDRDAVVVHLRKGDVLGASVAGQAKRVSVQRWDAQYVTGATDADLSFIYPEASPLPGGGNATVAYVAEADGWYGVITENGVGRYTNTVEVYRPGGSESATPQTIYLDFDGAVIDTSIFGGDNPRAKLSPLKSFLAGWGLTEADLPALAEQITATATENLQADLARRGIPGFSVKVVNGLRAPDTFGRPGVSRIIIGGTIGESGIETVGIAQCIDPGNFERAETALVLLDMMSAPVAGNPLSVVSLNSYIGPKTPRVKFVGRAIGNVVSHEAGHYIGNFHTDSKTVACLGAPGFRDSHADRPWGLPWCRRCSRSILTRTPIDPGKVSFPGHVGCSGAPLARPAVSPEPCD
ncbi:MAG: hypothetical protein U0Q10_03560 [Dermatophilaceae bacterium]